MAASGDSPWKYHFRTSKYIAEPGAIDEIHKLIDPIVEKAAVCRDKSQFQDAISAVTDASISPDILFQVRGPGVQDQRSCHRRLFVTLLGLAVRHKNPVLATCLFGAGADPNTGYHWNMSLHTGTLSIYSPIEEACLMQDVDMVRLLLKHGAKPNLPHNASSPLHAAIPMPIRMFDDGDHRTALRPGRSTPTAEQVRSSALIVGMLLEAGADPDRACSGESPPLHCCTSDVLLPVARLLLGKSTASVRAKASGGSTLLHFLASYNAAEMDRIWKKHKGAVQMLALAVSCGADVTAKNNDHQTPLELALEAHANPSIVAGLLQAGSPVPRSFPEYMAVQVWAGVGRRGKEGRSAGDGVPRRPVSQGALVSSLMFDVFGNAPSPVEDEMVRWARLLDETAGAGEGRSSGSDPTKPKSGESPVGVGAGPRLAAAVLHELKSRWPGTDVTSEWERGVLAVESPRAVRTRLWMQAVGVRRDAGMVFQAAAEGRPLELARRLRLGKLGGGLEMKGEVEDGTVVGPLEAARLGGHEECVRVLEEAMG